MSREKKPGPPAREAQLAYLAALGVTDPPPELDLAGARELIEETIARGGPQGEQIGPAEDAQIERIVELGGSPWEDISKGQASRLIAFLCERQPVCPKCAREARATDTRCPGCESFLSPRPVPHPGPEEPPPAAAEETPDETDGGLATGEVQATAEGKPTDEEHATDEADAADELWIANQVRAADEVGPAVDGRTAEAAHAAEEINATDELRIADEVRPADEARGTADVRAAPKAPDDTDGDLTAGEVQATDELRIADAAQPADEARAPPRRDRPIAAPGVCPYCGAMTDVPSGAVTVNCSGCHKLYPAEPLGQRRGCLGGLFRSGR